MKNIKMMVKLEGMLNKVKEYLSKQDEKRTDEKTLWNTFKGEYLNTVNDDIYREGMKKANEEFQKLAEVEDLIKMIKFDINVCRFLEGEKSLGNEEFEMLLKRFEIKVNPRTMSWIRKSLSMIGVGNYSYEGNKSGVVLDLADKLADALEDGYKFIDDSVIDSVIEAYEKTRKEYIEFITLDKEDVVDDSKTKSVVNDSKNDGVVNTFYIKTDNGDYKEVEGTRLDNKYGFELFYHDTFLGNYKVTHIPTGIALGGIISSSKEGLINELDKMVKTHGKDKVVEMLNYAISTHGTVPNYGIVIDDSKTNANSPVEVTVDDEEIATNDDYNTTMVNYAKSLDLKHYQKLRREVLGSVDVFAYASENNLSNDDIELMLYMAQELDNNDRLVSFPYEFNVEDNIATDDSKNDTINDSINDGKTESVVNEGNNTIDNDIKAKVIRVNNMLLCHNDSMIVVGNEYDLDKGKTYLKYGTYAIEVYYLDIGKICIKAYDSDSKVLNGNSRIVKGIKGILKLNNINWVRGSDKGSIEIDIDDV